MENITCPDFAPTFSDKKFCFYYQPSTPTECGFCKKDNRYRCEEDVRGWRKPIPLSYSSVSDFLTCHQLYYLKAVRGIQIVPSQVSMPLKLGTLWDRALQKYYGAKVDLNDIIDEYEIPEREVAKVKALFRAYKQLGIEVEPGGDTQAKINLQLKFEGWEWGNGDPVVLPVTGYYDRKYPTWFAENKLSGRPENYDDVWFIQSQVGTYFLADPSLEHCVMEVVRTPGLKPKDEEDAEEFGERCFKDIMARPSYYFQHLQGNKYGRKFFRAEFQLDELMSRYKAIFREIYEASRLDGFFRNDKVCSNLLPGIKCDMLPICRSGGMLNEEVFRIREIPF